MKKTIIFMSVFILLSSFSFAAWNSSLNSSILYYWSCDDDYGNNVTNQKGGVNLNVSSNYNIFSVGKFSNACQINSSAGLNSFNVLNSINANSTSLNFWMKITDYNREPDVANEYLQVGQQYLRIVNSTSKSFNTVFGTNLLELGLSGNPTPNFVTNENLWEMYTIVWTFKNFSSSDPDICGAKLYKNSTLMTSEACFSLLNFNTAQFQFSDYSFKLGNKVTNYNNSVILIDEISFFNSSLSSDDISAIYNNNDYKNPFGSAVNDVIPPVWSNLAVNNTLPKLNETVKFNITCQDNESGISSIIFSNNLTIWQNTTYSGLSGNVSFNVNYTIDYTRNLSQFSYYFVCVDNSGNMNTTNIFNLNLSKIRPNATDIAVSPLPALDTNNISGTFVFFDIENDSYVDNQTRWYVNGIEIPEFKNESKITTGYYGDGDTVTYSVQVYDGFNWSDWGNSSITINDNTAPVIHSLFPSAYSILTTDSLVLYANLTDNGNGLYAQSCTFEFVKANQWYNTTTLIGIPQNVTSNSYSNSLVSRSFLASTFTAGIFEWNKIYCQDISGNLVNNLTVNINITISVPSSGGGTPSGGGGGGGGGLITECSIDSDCSKFGSGYKCIESKCIKYSREDEALANLKAMGLSDSLINTLIKESNGICNWNGVCENSDFGEDRFNCGNHEYVINGENIIVKGDCSEFNISSYLPTGFLGTLLIGALILIIVLVLTTKKTTRVS